MRAFLTLNCFMSASSSACTSTKRYLYLRRLTDSAANTGGVSSLSVKRMTAGACGSCAM